MDDDHNPRFQVIRPRRPTFNPDKPEHMWVYIGLFAITGLGPEPDIYLDFTNLIDMNGPVCYFCQKRPNRARPVCPGPPHV